MNQAISRRKRKLPVTVQLHSLGDGVGLTLYSLPVCEEILRIGAKFALKNREAADGAAAMTARAALQRQEVDRQRRRRSSAGIRTEIIQMDGNQERRMSGWLPMRGPAEIAPLGENVRASFVGGGGAGGGGGGIGAAGGAGGGGGREEGSGIWSPPRRSTHFAITPSPR